MKIYVDRIPEHPKDCLFSEFDAENSSKKDIYRCQITRKICPYYKEGWTKTCPCLIEHKDSFNGYCTNLSNIGLSNYSNGPTTLEF